MYPKYFGLKEASFSITPDPQYLFLSEQHREALAHLLYGAGDSGGFVLLTGEVGTGKTMVCRAFLEQLPEGVDVALVLNPAMTAVELLHAICDEFGVEVSSLEQSAKALVDRLNLFLLEAHARGRHPVLIIDEAQNLRPKVMEQIRLLTNLETTKQKLLQIFLIGQPELRAMLASSDLRQLNQRITARFHLRPLSAGETAAYVDHRIVVAGVDRPLFTAAALRRVHRYSGGVPRLINLLCDRSLLGAAVSRRMQVTPAIVAQAAREVNGSDDGALPRRGKGLAVALSILLAAVAGLWVGASGVLPTLPHRLTAWTTDEAGSEVTLGQAGSSVTPAAEPTRSADSRSEPAQTEEIRTEEIQTAEIQSAKIETAKSKSDVLEKASVPEQPVSEADPEIALVEEPEGAEPITAPVLPESLPDAAIPRISMAQVEPSIDHVDADGLPTLLVADDGVVDELLRLWGVATDAVVSGLDCRAVAAFGLDCERGSGRWSELRLFDRPAALRLTLGNGSSGHVIVSGIDDEHATLEHGGGLFRVPIAVLDERWSGDYLVLWRLPPTGGRVIGRGSGGDSVAWLREQLASLPGSELGAKPARYDAQMTEAVKRFQSEQGLSVDGVAGPRTMILLSNVLVAADVPRLTHSH
ncbi:MAG: AAA family ATPase [Thiohalocapsa sp.]